MQVEIIRIFKDNYSYILKCLKTNSIALVDPADPIKVISSLNSLRISTVDSVLCTHHHNDHSNGNLKVKDEFKCKVFGGDDRVPGLTDKLAQDDIFHLGELKVRALKTRGHTTGSICYYVESGNESVVFTGDTLFVGGCGSFFEGNGQDMYESLSLLSQLKGSTRVYCGHDYAMANLKFALSVEPENHAIAEKMNSLANQQESVPSTIEDEKMFNPFMRVDMLKGKFKIDDSFAFMDHLRTLKNNFA